MVSHYWRLTKNLPRSLASRGSSIDHANRCQAALSEDCHTTKSSDCVMEWKKLIRFLQPYYNTMILANNWSVLLFSKRGTIPTIRWNYDMDCRLFLLSEDTTAYCLLLLPPSAIRRPWWAASASVHQPSAWRPVCLTSCVHSRTMQH